MLIGSWLQVASNPFDVSAVLPGRTPDVGDVAVIRNSSDPLQSEE